MNVARTLLRWVPDALPVCLSLASIAFAMPLPAALAADAPNTLSPIPTPFAKLLPATTPDHFTFVVAGDNRSTGHGHPMPPAFEEICREIGLIHPDFILWGGDVIEGYDDTPAEANAEYDTFLKSATLTGVPFFNAPGNHEFGDDPKLVAIYEKRLGKLYGSFDYGNSHFIALNTDPLSSDGKTVIAGTIDEPQFAWLEAELKASQGAKNRFVFMHHYVFGPPDTDPKLDTGFADIATRNRLHALFVKYKVRAVFCSHNHRYWHTVKDGIDYTVSGGAGAPQDASPVEGGYLHYVLLTVDGETMSTQILQPWHLVASYPDGDSRGHVLVDNTNNDPITVHALSLRAPLPSAGKTLAVAATIFYKGKTKAAAAHIVSWQPDKDGKTADVIVEANIAAHRGTDIQVSPTLSAKP